MAHDYDRPDRIAVERMSSTGMPRREMAIVPKNSIAGRALVAVVAIMTFLASLTTGAMLLVFGAAAQWQSDIAREMTIQVRPVAGRDLDAETQKAADIARAAAGIGEVRAYSKEESARLIEPWLGSDLSLDNLPVPRLIIVRAAAGQQPDLAAMRAALAQVPGASLDDHRGWIERMRTMAGAAIAGGIGILALMLAATGLSVAFATRGTMATNRTTIEVLHFIGAKDGYIAGQFQRHFLALGLKGGALGGGAALLLFVLIDLVGHGFTADASALFGTFAIGIAGYVAIIGQVILVAGITAVTSRRVVNRTLKTIG